MPHFFLFCSLKALATKGRYVCAFLWRIASVKEESVKEIFPGVSLGQPEAYTAEAPSEVCPWYDLTCVSAMAARV